jgi:hypothetical protein
MSENSFWATRMVKNTLTDSDTQKIKPFSFKGIGFDVKTFPVLKNYINQGKIKVEYDSTKAGSAEYDYKTNIIYVGFRILPSYTETALVVHECVHAVYDVVGQKMSVAVSEAIAYIVQSQYVYANAGPGKRLMSKNSSKDKTNLISAISGHPFYAKDAKSDAGFDGV